MKVKISLERGETLTDAEEILQKALNAKKDCSDSEQYEDKPLNDFHDYVCARHNTLLESLFKDIETEIKNNANK